jgi:hypothetical protein
MALVLRLQKGVQRRAQTLSSQKMLLKVDTRDALAVAVQVQSDYRLMFPDGDKLFVPQVFGWAIDCFTGKLPDYLPIDARYHDFEHTLQGTLCFSSVLRGRFQAGDQPVISRHVFELGLLAILLHDTGYLKRRDDPEGTGAKYTLTHVSRSCEFAAALLASKGYESDSVHAVQSMIRCTGVDTNLRAVAFGAEEERIVGFALGTGDLLGQMAAPDYVDKLPILYDEFVESARFNGKSSSTATFTSAEDLMSKTPTFWERYVRPKIERDFLGLFRFLANPVPNGPNNYIRCVEANISRLRQRLALAA